MKISSQEIDAMLSDMTQALQSYLSEHAIDDPLMIGIHTGGVWIAERLHQQLDLKTPLSSLDISFYRDDFTRLGINPRVKPSELTATVDDRDIILVDDVLYTGRTIRAALNEIFDYGRPASVALAVLIDRGGRELPIGPTVVGRSVPLENNQQIKIEGPDPLGLSIIEQEKA